MDARKTALIQVIIFTVCAVVWTINFVINLVLEDTLLLSTVLYGLSAVCWIIAAAGSILRLRKLRTE